MQVKALKIDFPKIIGFGFLLLILFLIIFATFLPKYTKIKELAQENDALSQKISQVESEIVALKKDLEAIKEDPFYLEKIAREQLGAVKDNEAVIHIEE